MNDENKFFWTILDALEEGVYFTNKKRQITYWNKAAEKITGFKSNEVLGKWCSEGLLCHVDDKGKSLCADECPVAKTLETGEVYKKEMYLHQKDGSLRPVHVTITPVFGNNNETIGAVEIFK
jgi:PAS domain S-box-containing protein